MNDTENHLSSFKPVAVSFKIFVADSYDYLISAWGGELSLQNVFGWQVTRTAKTKPRYWYNDEKPKKPSIAGLFRILQKKVAPSWETFSRFSYTFLIMRHQRLLRANTPISADLPLHFPLLAFALLSQTNTSDYPAWYQGKVMLSWIL